MINKKKIVTILGARPQFIKAAAVTPVLNKEGLTEIIIHTGQHYDFEMSEVFFKGLSLPDPHYHLGVGSHSHGKQTGLMLEKIEEVLIEEKPSLVVVYGDTNSTLAGALAAVKLHIPVAHIEAGLRSYDKNMPEEINRVLTDHISELLFSPTKKGVFNLKKEGKTKGVYIVGDVMYDLYTKNKKLFDKELQNVLKKYKVEKEGYVFVTIHRAENTDSENRWSNLTKALEEISKKGLKLIWPAHPRTKKLLSTTKVNGIKIIKPLPYLETQALIRGAKVVITDSGGVQKEAAFHKKPSLILRNKTEWVELLENNMAILVDNDIEKIVQNTFSYTFKDNINIKSLYGDGKSSIKIVRKLKEFLIK